MSHFGCLDKYTADFHSLGCKSGEGRGSFTQTELDAIANGQAVSTAPIHQKARPGPAVGFARRSYTAGLP